MMHPHEHDVPEYTHMKIRSKPFPWSCPNCELFESKCWAECRAAAD